MKTSIADFFKSNKNTKNGKTYVPSGNFNQSRQVKLYSAVENCEVAMNCIRIIQNEIIKSKPRHELNGVTQNDDITALFNKPNFYMDLTPFLKYIIFQYLLENNAYILKVYNKNADIVSMLPISPSDAEFLQDGRGGYFYRFKFNDTKIPDDPVEDWRIIHVKRDMTTDPFFGMSSWGSTADLLDLVNTYRVLSENLKDSTTTAPNVIFSYDDYAKASDYEKEANSFIDSIKKNKFGVLKPHTKIQDTMKLTSSQSATVEMLKYYQQAICNHFGVSEKILNNSASEEEYRAFYSRTIKPILQELSIAFTNAFFTPTQQKKGHKIVFAQDDMSLLSHKERIELFKAVQHSSAVLIDEQRAIIGFNELPNGAGQVLMVQLDAEKKEINEIEKPEEEEKENE